MPFFHDYLFFYCLVQVDLKSLAIFSIEQAHGSSFTNRKKEESERKGQQENFWGKFGYYGTGFIFSILDFGNKS
jgi:hypothetical protein